MRNNSQLYAYENTLSQSSDSKKEDHHIQEIKRIITKPREFLLSNGHSYSLILPRVSLYLIILLGPLIKKLNALHRKAKAGVFKLH